MSRQILFRSRARRELDDAAQWYERERPELAAEFVKEIDHLLVRLMEAPTQFPVVAEDVRRALVRRFPFGVYFVPEETRVVVLAVVHLHGHPDAWRRHRRMP